VSIETLAYEPARRDEVFELLERVRGYSTDEREFDWWFDGNPVGPRTIALAQEDGRLAGVLGASFYRTVVQGRETLAALPLWAVTDEAFRGRGIFQRLNAEIERIAREAGATLELGFTNRMAGPIYIAKLGWLDVHRLRVWARPLLPGTVPRRGTVPRADPNAFAPAAERTYRAVAPGWPSHFVRDSAYLNWRYVESPRNYTLLQSRNGYAVVGRKELRRRETAFIADLVAPTRRETRWLLRRAARAARGARVLLALVPPGQLPAYAAFGFVPTPMTIRLIGHALDGELPTGLRAWHFTLGDTDFF
jgi:GNAT superfamily N-acetyltransferase